MIIPKVGDADIIIDYIQFMRDEYEPQVNRQMNNETFDNKDKEKQSAVSYETPGVSAYSANQRYVTFIPYGMTPNTYEEKRHIKKSALMIGASLLIMLVFSLVWGFGYLIVMRCLGYTSLQASDFIQNPAIMQVLQIALSSLMFTVPFLIIYRSCGERISDLVLLVRPKKDTVLPFFLFGISFCAFANIAVSQASTFFNRFGINYNVDFGENPKGIFGFLLYFLATAIVPPLIEEFAFRGLILGLLRKYGDGFAVMVSSILFGLMHGNFQQIPFAFLVGLVLGYIVVKTDTLWVSMAVHAFNNAVSVVFEYFLNNLSSNVQNFIYAIFLTVCILLGLVAILILSNKDKNFYKFEKSNTEATEKQKMKWFFTSVIIIAFIIICIAESFAYFS